MSASTLKIIAIIGMTMNHIAYAFGSIMPNSLYYVTMAPGGLTFPIMAYLMSEGYKHTRNVRKYAFRLFIFALLSQIPYSLVIGDSLNVMFTLLACLLVLYLNDHMISRSAFWFAFGAITLLTIACDWALMSVPMVLCYYCIRDRYQRVVVPLCFVWGMTLVFVLLQGLPFTRAAIAQLLYGFVGCSATIPLLLAYNGKKGRSVKYLFYIFYPLHLLVIALIQMQLR